MSNQLIKEFQHTISEFLVRNKSILDGITKFQDACARTNRSIVKSVTHCGCCKVNAQKPELDEDVTLDNMSSFMESHWEGPLCNYCKDFIEKEMGKTVFYLASLCNTLNLDLNEIISKELERVKILGKFSLR